jgi:hypothetical protein
MLTILGGTRVVCTPPAAWRSCRRILAGLRGWPFRFRRLMLAYGCIGDWRSLRVLSRNQLGNDDAYWL